jgi:hypothetical protein
MARFTSAFAQHFNWRHARSGHLFQGRYRSRLVRDERDLRWILLYVLGNPVRHQIVDAAGLDAYPWSGWSGAVGARPAYEFETFAAVHAAFGGAGANARRNLHEALAAAVATRWTPPPDDRLERLVIETCARLRIERTEILGVACSAPRAQLEVIRRATRELRVPWRAVAVGLCIPRIRIARALRTVSPASEAGA